MDKLYEIRADEYLFYNSRRQKLTRKGIEYIVEKYFTIAKENNPEIKRKHIQEATKQLIDLENYDIQETCQ